MEYTKSNTYVTKLLFALFLFCVVILLGSEDQIKRGFLAALFSFVFVYSYSKSHKSRHVVLYFVVSTFLSAVLIPASLVYTSPDALGYFESGLYISQSDRSFTTSFYINKNISIVLYRHINSFLIDIFGKSLYVMSVMNITLMSAGLVVLSKIHKVIWGKGKTIYFLVLIYTCPLIYWYGASNLRESGSFFFLALFLLGVMYFIKGYEGYSKFLVPAIIGIFIFRFENVFLLPIYVTVLLIVITSRDTAKIGKFKVYAPLLAVSLLLLYFAFNLDINIIPNQPAYTSYSKTKYDLMQPINITEVKDAISVRPFYNLALYTLSPMPWDIFYGSTLSTIKYFTFSLYNLVFLSVLLYGLSYFNESRVEYKAVCVFIIIFLVSYSLFDYRIDAITRHKTQYVLFVSLLVR